MSDYVVISFFFVQNLFNLHPNMQGKKQFGFMIPKTGKRKNKGILFFSLECFSIRSLIFKENIKDLVL